MAEKKLLYVCDPDRNAECRKTGCHKYGQYSNCRLTLNPAYAVRDANGEPVVAAELRGDTNGTV